MAGASISAALMRPAAIAASFVVSALIAWVAIRYAHRRGLVDLPGQRRSHSVPTPRGGGLGIAVTAVAVCLFVYFGLGQGGDPSRLVVALTLVAAAGWIDDHRGLGALPRIIVHAAACALFLAPWLGKLFSAPAAGEAAFAIGLLFFVAWFGCVWSINLHNFMDGINGLLAAQAAFVLAALGALCLTAKPAHALVLSAWAAAALGFLPFNFPRACIFLGDVGSGALGLMIAVGVLWQMAAPDTAAVSGLIACSAFVADASCTLISRMLRGRRWYSAHREHLYQWLVRSGFSHARVVGYYMGWNLFVVVPVLYAVNRDVARAGSFIGMFAVYALALGVWISGKRWCLRRVAAEKTQEA